MLVSDWMIMLQEWYLRASCLIMKSGLNVFEAFPLASLLCGFSWKPSKYWYLFASHFFLFLKMQHHGMNHSIVCILLIAWAIQLHLFWRASNSCGVVWIWLMSMTRRVYPLLCMLAAYSLIPVMLYASKPSFIFLWILGLMEW